MRWRHKMNHEKEHYCDQEFRMAEPLPSLGKSKKIHLVFIVLIRTEAM